MKITACTIALCFTVFASYAGYQKGDICVIRDGRHARNTAQVEKILTKDDIQTDEQYNEVLTYIAHLETPKKAAIARTLVQLADNKQEPIYSENNLSKILNGIALYRVKILGSNNVCIVLETDLEPGRDRSSTL